MKEIRITQITVDEEAYYVMYPSPAPAEGPGWMILDADGGPVCVDETVDDLRDDLPDEFVDALEAAARAAVARRAGEPLEERLTVPGDSAFEWAERFGWLVSCGPGEVITPNTRVWLPYGVPHIQPGKDLAWLMSFLSANCRWEGAVALPPRVPAPPGGVVVTAAELAAGQ